jgi:hypothetical protein
VSGLETLSPDQRAVLQLILVQGRGYADLAATLKLDVAAVRERAHAGAEALGLPAGAELDGEQRGRIVDYLLGQQDDGERIVTFAELGDSPAASRWAQALRERLAGVAREELPEVPAATAVAVTNGSVASDVAVAPVPAPAAVPTPAAAASAPAAAPPAPPPAAKRPAPTAAAAAPPRTPSGGSGDPGGPTGPRPSRLGGAILIAGAAALAIVLAIVLIGGGSDKPSRTAGATSPAQTQANARTQSSSTGSTGTSTNAAAQARTVGAAALRPTAAGSSALGAALVQQSAGGRRLMAVEAARLPPNGTQDIYAIWLQGSAGTRFLGFVPSRVGTSGSFTVSSSLPKGLDLRAYATVLVTREGTTATPTTPGPTVLSGSLRLAG